MRPTTRRLAQEGHAENDPNLSSLRAAKFTEWLKQGNWEVTAHDPTSVTFERLLPWSLKIIKRYTLEPVPAGSRQDPNFPGYNLRLDVEVQNTGMRRTGVAYRLDGPTGLPIEGWWYAHKISRSIGSVPPDSATSSCGSRTTPCCRSTARQIAEEGANRLVRARRWPSSGVDAVYFSAVFIPVKNFARGRLARQHRSDPRRSAAGRPHSRPFHQRLLPAHPQAGRARCRASRRKTRTSSSSVRSGPTCSPSTKPPTIPTIPSETSSTTVCGRSAPSPAACSASCTSSTASSATMASPSSCSPCSSAVHVSDQLQADSEHGPHAGPQAGDRPHQRKIQRRHAEAVAAMQELYRKNKINPLGGCLPVFLQLPIFIGLYRSIMVDVELRQSPLFGAVDSLVLRPGRARHALRLVVVDARVR